MSEIMDKLKAIKPWQYGAIGIVAVLGIMASRRKKYEVVSQAAENPAAVPGFGGGSSGGFDISGEINSIKDQLNNVLVGQNEKIDQVQKNTQEQLNQSNLLNFALFNSIAESFNNYKNNTNGAMVEVAKSAQTKSDIPEVAAVTIPTVNPTVLAFGAAVEKIKDYAANQNKLPEASRVIQNKAAFMTKQIDNANAGRFGDSGDEIRAKYEGQLEILRSKYSGV